MKQYIVQFHMNGKPFETQRFDSNEEAMKFIQGHWHHRFWSFKVVCNNDVHKIWYAV